MKIENMDYLAILAATTTEYESRFGWPIWKDDITGERKLEPGFEVGRKDFGFGIYEGGLLHDKPIGRGCFTLANGATIEGDFLDYTVSGAEVSFTDGSRYAGDMMAVGEKYIIHGKGRLTTATQTIEGHFDFAHLIGEATVVDRVAKTTFKGNFAYDQRVGFGRLTFDDGGYAEGVWDGDHVIGRAVVGLANGDVWSGMTNRYHKPWGVGKMEYANGDVYFGRMAEVRDGFGLFVSAAGTCFTGEFDEGEFSRGILILPSGEQLGVRWLPHYKGFVGLEFSKREWTDFYLGTFPAEELERHLIRI